MLAVFSMLRLPKTVHDPCRNPKNLLKYHTKQLVFPHIIFIFNFQESFMNRLMSFPRGGVPLHLAPSPRIVYMYQSTSSLKHPLKFATASLRFPLLLLRREERECRFCSTLLPPWQEALLPQRVKPAPEALVNVHAPDGSLHRIPLQPGMAGRRRFLRAVRHALCLRAHVHLDMSFEVAVPITEGTLPKVVYSSSKVLARTAHAKATFTPLSQPQHCSNPPSLHPHTPRSPRTPWVQVRFQSPRFL